MSDETKGPYYINENRGIEGPTAFEFSLHMEGDTVTRESAQNMADKVNEVFAAGFKAGRKSRDDLRAQLETISMYAGPIDWRLLVKFVNETLAADDKLK
jgi:hypothetical protein